MDLHTFMEKLKALAVAAKAGDWATVFAIAFELIPIILQAWSGPKPMLAGVETKSVDELAAELQQYSTMTFGPSEGLGPIVKIAWPILRAMLIKILQGL